MTESFLNQIVAGDVLDCLRALPDGVAQCCVSSPPYWGLRCYGTEAVIWDGDPDCSHDWEDRRYYQEGGGGAASSSEAFSKPGEANAERIKKARWREDSLCRCCGAWRGSLGLEPTPELYVQHIVQIFREVRRILRDDGTLWLNLGDGYCCQPSAMQNPRSFRRDRLPRGDMDKRALGLKLKDLCGIPWRVAFALQSDGWWLRSDIIWSKKNAMPESVRDRPTRSHEYIFLMTKAAKYFYDADAVREGSEQPGRTRRDYVGGASWDGRQQHSKGGEFTGAPTRNLRSVWKIATQGFPGAHFAVMPEALVARCILAGTSAKGACRDCGAPHARQTETPARAPGVDTDGKWNQADSQSMGHRMARNMAGARVDGGDHDNPFPQRQTVGWALTCSCPPAEAVPCLVLDPFMGAGTTAAVARTLGRSYWGCDLNADYVAMALRRVGRPALGPSETEDLPLFGIGG